MEEKVKKVLRFILENPNSSLSWDTVLHIDKYDVPYLERILITLDFAYRSDKGFVISWKGDEYLHRRT